MQKKKPTNSGSFHLMMHFIVQPQKARPILAQTKQKKKKHRRYYVHQEEKCSVPRKEGGGGEEGREGKIGKEKAKSSIICRSPEKGARDYTLYNTRGLFLKLQTK